jgi:hypothetical protein
MVDCRWVFSVGDNNNLAWFVVQGFNACHPSVNETVVRVAPQIGDDGDVSH